MHTYAYSMNMKLVMIAMIINNDDSGRDLCGLRTVVTISPEECRVPLYRDMPYCTDYDIIVHFIIAVMLLI